MGFFEHNEQEGKVKVVYKKPGLFSYIIIALISSIAGGIIMSYIAPMYLYGNIIPYPYPSGQTIERIILTQEDPVDLIPAIAQKVIPSVVGISTVSQIRDFFFERRYSQGFGSGIIVHQDGYILTNDHVVANANEINVLLHDGRTVKGELKWTEPHIDIAIIKIDAPDLIVADLGDSDSLIVGETVVAIGNPLGLRFQRTVTSGIISGLERSLVVGNQVMEDLIQTDASINPGNSGGPLLNKRGEVIGINTVKASQGEAMGFAVPINIAKPIIEDVIQYGRFRRPYLGITGTDRELAQLYGRRINVDKGVLVTSVESGSPADRGGLRAEDIIIAIDGKEINSMAKLRVVLFGLNIGKTVEIDIIRGGKRMTLQVELQEMPHNL